MAGFSTPPRPSRLTSFRFTARQISQTVTNTTAETAWTFDSPCVIPAGVLQVGSILRVIQGGVYQAGISQNVRPRIRIGPAGTAMAARTIAATTAGAVSGLLNAASDTPWLADTEHVVLANNTLMPIGRLFFSTSLTAALAAIVAQKDGVSGINYGVDNVLTASAEWGAAMSANQITCTLFQVEVTRPS